MSKKLKSVIDQTCNDLPIYEKFYYLVNLLYENSKFIHLADENFVKKYLTEYDLKNYNKLDKLKLSNEVARLKENERIIYEKIKTYDKLDFENFMNVMKKTIFIDSLNSSLVIDCKQLLELVVINSVNDDLLILIDTW